MYNYIHGGDIYNLKNKVVDFSANINPLGMPKSVKNALKKASNNCEEYPDPFCRKLVSLLAQKHKILSENILCGNGAADLLYKFALALKPKRTLLLAPTFADYEKALEIVGNKCEYYNLRAKNDFTVTEGIVDKISTKLDLIVLCSPNNPTGQIINKTLMLKILNKAKKCRVKVLVDECFMEFVSPKIAYTLINEINKYKNLFVLRAFTKSYAMAGVRLGYLVTSDISMLDKCRENSQDWSVSTLAQAAGLAALQEKTYLKKSIIYVEKERNYLVEKLKELNITTFGPKANYILLKTDIKDFYEKLFKEGIVIRKCVNYRNLDRTYYRIAVRTTKENKKLIKTIKGILNK